MAQTRSKPLDESHLIKILDVARRLAAPGDLQEILARVIDAARDVLRADRGSVFLYDPARRELVLKVATGLSDLRFGIDKGIAGQCARDRAIVNVPDCYADPRFNPEIDRQTGYRTHCLIAVPLVGLDEQLVGVMQVLNAAGGNFDPTDEHIAEALASQAAVAVQRALLIDERMIKLKLERDLDLAKQIQQGVLPTKLPAVPGYELAVFSRPAEQTGGDIYDLVLTPPWTTASPAGEIGRKAGDLLIFMADATGHGVGPALSVTQARSMVRLGLRLGAPLDDLVLHINRQVYEDLAAKRFITAFFGRLDPAAHRIDYHAAGQGPLLHFHAANQKYDSHPASTVPLGILDELPMGRPEAVLLAPGDIFILLTDGFYEQQNPHGEMLGVERVVEVIRLHRGRPAEEILRAIVEELAHFANGSPQLDDLTAVLVKRIG